MRKRSVNDNIMVSRIVGCFMIILSALTFADPPEPLALVGQTSAQNSAPTTPHLLPMPGAKGKMKEVLWGQVARLSYLNGTVSFLPAGETQWVGATLNRPLITNDQIWSDTGALVEMQLSGAAVRMGEQTNLKILNLNDEIAQFQITQGTLVLSIKRLNSKQVYEVNTPNLAFTIAEPGYYRFDVLTQNNTTTVSVREGTGIAYGENSSNTINADQSCSATGTNLEDFQCTSLGEANDFESWSLERDEIAGTVSTQYISPYTIGYEDLGNYGDWTEDDQYGPVWYPNNVEPNWTPYQAGQWIWLGLWGWTWVDVQPWGFAPFHYGRWAFKRNRWCWVPGPIGARPIFAPALTVFIGGNNPQFKLDGSFGIGWFPLAPGEPYIPPFHVSQDYFTAINLGNTVIDIAFINKIYKNHNMKINYKNAQNANAVTVVPIKDFINSRIVNNVRARVPNQILFNLTKTQVAPVAPQSVSVLGGNRFIHARPPEKIASRSIIVRTQPSLPTPSFSEVQPLLLKNAGRPLTPEQIMTIKGNQVIGTKPGVAGHTPTIIKQLPPVIIHPVPATHLVPGAQPVPNVQPGPNIQHGYKIYPNPSGQPTPNVQPGPTIHHGHKVHPNPSTQPGPGVQHPIVHPGPNVQPSPNIYPPAYKVQPSPGVQPSPNTYPGYKIQPSPSIQPGPSIQSNPNIYPEHKIQPNPVQPAPRPIIRPGPMIHPTPGIQSQPMVQPPVPHPMPQGKPH